MDPAKLAEFEEACEFAMGARACEDSVRRTAQARVMSLGGDLRSIAIIQAVLDRSNNNHAITAASNSLNKLVSEHWTSFSEKQRIEIRNYLLTWLANKGPKMQPYAWKAVIALLCRVTKFAWFDDPPPGSAAAAAAASGGPVPKDVLPPIREIVKETKRLLEGSIYHCVIGLRILNELVTEMNVKARNRTVTQHRKVAVSFRDICLLDVFEMGLTMLNQIATRAVVLDGLSPPEAARIDDTMLNETLSLLNGCLSFDFIGTYSEEMSEDQAPLQVPAAWRDRIQTGVPLRLLFNVYKGCCTGHIASIPDAPPPPVSSAAVTSMGVGMRRASGGFDTLQSTRDFRRSSARAAQALEALALIISVRKSLFASETDRKRFVSQVMRGVCDILREELGLNDEDCYHRFCKLLARVKSNMDLKELVKAEGYAEWIELTANFTVKCCAQPLWSSNSMHYVLGLWSKLVQSMHYSRYDGGGTGPGSTAAESKLEKYVPNIVGAYVRGRVDSIVGPNAEDAREELSNLDTVEDQLEQLPILFRYQYDMSATAIIELMDPLMQRYGDALGVVQKNLAAIVAKPNADVVAHCRIMECQLAWIVAMIGAVVGGAGSTGSSSYPSTGTVQALGDEQLDANLCRRVLQLVGSIDGRMTSIAGSTPAAVAARSPFMLVARPDERLELALLYFMTNFRKSYLSESSGIPLATPLAMGADASAAPLLASATMPVRAPSAEGGMSDGPAASASANMTYAEMLSGSSGRHKTFNAMYEQLGQKHDAVAQQILSKVTSNLRFWSESNEIIRRSIDILHDMVQSYAAARLLLSLEFVKSMLAHHGPDQFPFLGLPANVRHRTTFYAVLGRLVFFEDDPDRFERFAPALLSVLDRLATATTVRNDEVLRATVGIARDLRGVAQAATSRTTYAMLFEALYPKHLATLSALAATWNDVPQVTTPILKFFAEFVFQRTQRIQFGSNSPNGILLFREASKLIVNYGTRLLPATVAEPQRYSHRYKGISIVLSLLTRCLEGGFVNFGVFALYRDPALDQAMEVAFKLALSIPLAEVSGHAHVHQQYMAFVSVVTRSHMDSLVTLPTPAFMQVVRSISEGLDNLDLLVSEAAASALDNLSTYFVRNAKKDTPVAAALRAQVGTNPAMFPTLMKGLFQILVFNEGTTQWQLCRPMLPTILAAELQRPDVLEDFKKDVVASQPLPLRPRMEDEFRRLAADITRSLDILNRDRFTTRLQLFQQSVRTFATL